MKKPAPFFSLWLFILLSCSNRNSPDSNDNGSKLLAAVTIGSAGGELKTAQAGNEVVIYTSHPYPLLAPQTPGKSGSSRMRDIYITALANENTGKTRHIQTVTPDDYRDNAQKSIAFLEGVYTMAGKMGLPTRGKRLWRGRFDKSPIYRNKKITSKLWF